MCFPSIGRGSDSPHSHKRVRPAPWNAEPFQPGFSVPALLEIFFTVCAHRALYLLERGAFAGERVLDARGMTPVLAPLDESFRFELSQFLGERARAHAAQRVLKLAEPSHA